MEEFVCSMLRDGIIEYEDYDLDYHVVNYYATPLTEYTYRKLPIWFVGRKGAKYEHFKKLSSKYPSFLEILICDIVHGYIWENGEEVYYSGMYEEYYALVMEEEERCIVSEYPKLAVFGVHCNPAEKRVTVYDKRQAVDMFHEWYGKTKSVMEQ